MRSALQLALCLALASSAWGAFGFQRTLTVTNNATLLPSTQTNFTVPVVLSDPTLKTVANGGHVQNSSGFDICFFSDSMQLTLLSWKMDSYDGVNGNVMAWVKVPTLALGTVIYMAYGNASIVTFQGGATGSEWETNYKAVWNFGTGTVLSFSDSTVNANNLTGSNSPTATAGKIGGGINFSNASSQSASVASAALKPASLTVSLWYRGAGSGTSSDRLFSQGTAAGPPFGNVFFFFSNLGYSTAVAAINVNGSNVQINPDSFITMTTGVWYKYDATYDGSTVKWYWNGAMIASTGSAGSITYGAEPWVLGGGPNSSGGFQNFFNGAMSHFTISATPRSANWLTAEYNSQNAPNTFLALGGESPLGGGTALRMLLGVGGF